LTTPARPAAGQRSHGPRHGRRHQQTGHAIGIRTIAEFIEDDAVLHTLRELAIDFAQGYHIHMPQALPIPASQVIRMGG
jgi:EAL domain-containing protein (putative c-di-GMP-specific phosphodiesterase class I)